MVAVEVFVGIGIWVEVGMGVGVEGGGLGFNVGMDSGVGDVSVGDTVFSDFCITEGVAERLATDTGS
jgi:hypothetical protein